MGMVNGKMIFTNFLENLRKPVREEYREVICPEHGAYKSKFVIYDDNSAVQEDFCPKCIEAQKKQEEAKLKRYEREEYIRHCKKCNVEPEFYDKTLDDYEVASTSQEAALNAAKEILGKKLRKLVLLGENGIGKSMLGSVLAREMNGKIYSMYEITTMIRQSYTVRAEKTELEIVDELATVPFLAIDEMGRTKGSKSEMDWLSYILDKRHVRKLPFMLMANAHLRKNCPENGCDKCFENYMDKDIISRLRQDSKIINVLAEDYRKKRL